MPRSGRVPRSQVSADEGRSGVRSRPLHSAEGWTEARDTVPDDWEGDDRFRPDVDARHSRPPGPGVGRPGRRTVTITGQGAEGYHSRNGTRPSAAARHRQIKRHERAGFRPDRVAMWAVLLGVMLMLAAATSSHAAVVVAHHASLLARLMPR